MRRSFCKTRFNRNTITLVYSAVSLLVIGALVSAEPLPSQVQLIGIVLLIAVCGLPHGALDAEIGTFLDLTHTIRGAFLFFMGYVLLALSGIALWLWLPPLALSLFLVISIFHFSDDWQSRLGRPMSVALAVAVVGLPAIGQPDAVAQILTWLFIPAPLAPMFVTILAFGAGIGLLLVVGTVMVSHRGRWPVIVEVSLLSISALVMSPVLYFALYFCLIHAQRHMLDCSRLLDLSLAQCYLKSLPILFLTVLCGGVSYWLFASAGLSTNLIRWLFIGLFALTLPHMALITYWNRRRGSDHR